MPAVRCPIEGCDYTTEDLDAAIVAALLTTHSSVHTHAPVTTAKVEKVKRPTISACGTSEEWTYFQSRWTEYVDATKISGKDMVIQLLECCDESLRKDLTRTAGGSLVNKPVDDVMTSIKALAVRTENTMVARVALQNMRQDRDEPICNYGARLKGQAGECKFSVSCSDCNRSISYMEEMTRDVLIRGLADSDIQMDLLGDKNQDMTLEEVLKFVEAKEAGKRSASRLQEPCAAEAISSTYQRKRRETPIPHEKSSQDPCGYCGKHGHGKSSPLRIRRKECPAYGHKCQSCTRYHHLESVCRSKDKPKPRDKAASGQGTDDCEGAVFDALCSVTVTKLHNKAKAIALDHHVYDQLNDTWVRRASKPQPFVNLSITVCADDYEELGFKLQFLVSATPMEHPSKADTGCQSCLACIGVLH